MKIAIVHDQLREFGGAERVLVSLKKLFPSADVYTSTFDLDTLGKHKEQIKSWNVQTSWFGKIPVINRLYSPLRFLTPLIWESLDLSGYDLVISSTGSWMCKGVKTKKPTVHISYIHHPPRYLYGYQTAIEWQKYPVIRIYGTVLNHFLRMWDFDASKRPDYLIANSFETQKRIRKFYRRDSKVIYPPVTIPQQVAATDKTGKYFITVSRLAKAKHIDLLIRTASTNNIPLKIVGIGRDMDYLKTLAGDTVEFLGNVSDQELDRLYANAYGFLFSSVDEEFGIAPVEAMAHGLPVIAYASGGLVETVKDGRNGFLFHELNESSLFEKIRQLQSLGAQDYENMRKTARKEAEQYSEERFMNEMRSFIHTVLHPSEKA
jgi:glycosyltransferase involved in cell wall biosynthesis